jgi:hypothetical protein
MKNILKKAAITALLLMTSLLAFSQKAWYFGPDATVNVSDSVVIRLNDYEGSIQWQRSPDLNAWENIPGATQYTLLFIADNTSFFRAEVIAGDCDPFYSDTTFVGVYRLNEDIKLIDENVNPLISDSLEIANGIYRFTGQLEDVQIGSVILGQQGEGFMRRVTSIEQFQDEYIMQTLQANMEDVFDDFYLQDSLVITLNQSKTIMYGGKPLPLKVLYLPPGASLKKDRSGINFSNDTIYHDNYLSVIMEGGSVNFEPTIYREFDYKHILGIPAKLRSMKLTAGGMMEASMGLKVISSQQICYENSILIGKFAVAVPAGPVPIVVILSFYLGFDVDMQLQMYATAGVESSYQVAFGAEYHKDANPQWSEVWEEESSFLYTPPAFSVQGFIEAKAYVQPELAITITGLAGPTFAVDPYLRFKGEVEFPEWNWQIAAGIGGSLGFQVGLFGYYILDYNINLFTFDYILANGTSTIEAEIPTVETLPVTNITSSTAQSGGNVTNDGGAAVTANGVVWSTSPNPTISNNQGYATNGSGTGSFTSNLTGLAASTEYYVRAYAINSSGTGYGQQESFTTLESGNGDWPIDTDTEVVEVLNPATGRIWMDRNLGATRAATGSTDAEAYGHLYQWGRPADGHQVKTSSTTSTLSSSDTAGHGNFILAPNYPFDWRCPQNHNLWQGVTGINNPCPAGYRLPTEAELDAERLSWSSNDSEGAFASPLKLPMAGGRENGNGSFFDIGSGGSYWSSTFGSYLSRDMFFALGYAEFYSNSRAYGFSVRCLRMQ